MFRMLRRFGLIGGVLLGPVLIWRLVLLLQQGNSGSPIFAVMLLAAIAWMVALLWLLPKLQVRSASAGANEQKGPFELENEARRTMAQIIGGLAILLTLYSTISTLNLSRDQLALARQGQIADRLTKAYSLFADPKMRVFGIYSLQSAALDSPKDHWPVLELLTAYVRENAAWDPSRKGDAPKPGPEIEAIMKVLQQRDVRNEKNQSLEFDNDQDTLLAIAGWEKDPELDKKIDLREADLRRVDLLAAYLKRAILSGTHLESAILEDAHLERIYAPGVYFDHADLRGAHLQWAYLAEASFERAQIEGADLRHTYGTTQEQIDSAEGDDSTRLPSHLKRPDAWPHKQ